MNTSEKISWFYLKKALKIPFPRNEIRRHETMGACKLIPVIEKLRSPGSDPKDTVL